MQAYQIKAGQQIAGLEWVQRSIPSPAVYEVKVRVPSPTNLSVHRRPSRTLKVSCFLYLRTPSP